MLDGLTPQQRQAVLGSWEYAYWMGHGCTIGSSLLYEMALRDRIEQVKRDL